MPTPCPWSQRLCRHCVHGVNDYADTVSMESTTMPTPCPRSQRLCRHCVHGVNHNADNVSMESTTMPTPCPRSKRLCRHRVRIVNNYADIMSMESTTMPAHVCIVNDHADTQFSKFIYINFFVTFIGVFLIFFKI